LRKFSYQHIIDGQGFEISVAGIIIVFTALISISLFIYFLPKILNLLDKVLPEMSHNGHGHQQKTVKKKDDQGTIAAIAYALHQGQSGK
jgi:Na+-transporting methylmalonyl-CoA/oxaloacetate decarboxylase gamma subunit